MPDSSEGFSSLKLEQFLNRASVSAMILLDGKGILSRVGDFSPEAFQQFAEVINRYWPAAKLQKRDRFVVQPLSGRYHFVFAKRTPVLGNRLGLAFPLEAPLVHIRQDMADLLSLVHEMEGKQLDDAAGLEQSLQLKGQSTSSPDFSPDFNAKPYGWQMEMDSPGQFKDASVPEQPVTAPNAEDDQTLAALPHASSNENPTQPGHDCGADPGKVDESADQHAAPRWEPLDALVPPEPMTDGLENNLDLWASNQMEKSWQSLDASAEGEDLASILQGDLTIDQDQVIDEKQPQVMTTVPKEPVNEIPHRDKEEAKPVSRQMPHLSLSDTVFDTTFYLVPRINHHYLLGELAHRLREWLPRLCELYGWQLDLLSVRPDYLKWTLGDFPECLTREMLAVIRRETTEQISRVFPTLLTGYVTQDFWSPGYLVDTQNRDFPTQVLIAHVSKARFNGHQPDFETLNIRKL